MRRMNVPAVVAGGLGMLACSAGFVAMSGLFEDKIPLLVVTHPVAAGQLITAADLRTVQVAADSGIDAIPASQTSNVVGRPAAMPLAPGGLLARADLGPAVFPPTGQAVTAVGLKPGMFPLNLASGDRVQVVLPATAALAPATPAAAAQQPLTATVTAVAKPDSQGIVVANLLLDEAGAARVAAASTSMSGVAVTVLSAGGS